MRKTFLDYYFLRNPSVVQEGFYGNSLPKAVQTSASYLQRELGQRLYPVGNGEVIYFKNEQGSGQGYEFVIGTTEQLIRFNTDPAGQSIESIDLFDGSPTPSFRIGVEGLSMVQALPQLVDIIKNPHVGEFEIEDDGEGAIAESVVIQESGDRVLQLLEFMHKKQNETNGEYVSKKEITNLFNYYALNFLERIKHFNPDAIDIDPAQGYKLLKPIEEIDLSQVVKKGKGFVTPGTPEQTITRTGAQASKMMQEDFTDNPEELFEDLETLVVAVGKGVRPSLVITGGPGTGKTFVVNKTLQEKCGLRKGEDYHVVKGKTSPMGLYQTLFLLRKSLIVFDDCDSIFDNDDAVNILKAALDSYETREVSWNSKQTFDARGMDDASVQATYDDTEKLPNIFEFKGRIIFVSNRMKSEIDSAVVSRSLAIEINLSPEQLFERMETLLDAINPGVEYDVKKRALDVLRTQNGTKAVTMRSLVSAIDFAVSGTPNWERLVRKYV